MRSILERLKSRFNVSVADLDGGERGAPRPPSALACAAEQTRIWPTKTIQKAVEFISSERTGGNGKYRYPGNVNPFAPLWLALIASILI